MKKLLLLSLFLPALGYSAVQGCVSSASAAAASCAMGSSITSGNLLVVTTKAASNPGNSVVVTSSSGVSCSWQLIGTPQNVSSSFSAQMAYCNITSSGAETVTATWSGGGTGTFADITVTEYNSGTGFATPALDQQASFVKASSDTTCNSGSTSATTNAADLVVGVCECFNSAQTWGAVSGYTNQATSSRNTTGYYDKSVVATGVQSFSGTLSAADVDVAFVAAFKTGGASAVVKGRIWID